MSFKQRQLLKNWIKKSKEYERISFFLSQLLFSRSARLQKIEKETALRKTRTKQLEIEAMEAQARDLADYQKKQENAAKQAKKEANKKLAGSNERTRTLTTKVKDLNEQRMQDRTEAVLELKANVDAVRAEVATLAEKHVRKIEKAKKQLEDEKEHLLAQGLNPYVEFRKKEIAEEAERKEKRLKATVEKNKQDLAAQLEKEHKFLEKQEKAKREAMKYEKQHRESLGRHVIEDRNRRYIESKTSAHTEVLDPTGKASRVDPSQITDVADFSFGLGKSSRIPKDKMKSITEQIREQLKVEKEDLGEYQRLVSGLKKATAVDYEEDSGRLGGGGDDESTVGPVGKPANSTSAEIKNEEDQEKLFGAQDLYNLEVLGSANGEIPGADKPATVLNYNNDEIMRTSLLKLTTEEEGETADESKRIESLPTPKYATVKLSKFEQDAFERAKDRHRDRIEQGTIQVAGGKVFKGDSFAATPSTLLYKDFELGKIYKKHLTLTNVSYSFNSFKLLDLEDEFIDFFTITFERPGRMSAGMSCSIEVVFKPQLNQDIFTFLRLLTETGPVNIPLQCLIRRCAPRIIDTSLDFQEMIIGQRQTLPVKIVNSQALATTFSIEEIPNDDDNMDFNFSVLTNDPTEALSATVMAAANDDEEGNAEKETKNTPSALQIETGVDTNDGTKTGVLQGSYKDSAVNELDLWTRVKRIMTKILREKRKQQQKPFVCFISSSFEDPTSPMKSISSPTQLENDGGNEDNDINIRKEILVTEGVVPGYDQISLTVRSAPLLLGSLERTFVVKFHSVDESANSVDEQGQLVTKEQYIKVKVQCEEVPIYIEDNIIDLKCCLHQRIYRKKLLIHNRGKIAYRLNIKVPKQFRSFIEVGPSVFFVQSNASQSINIKFTPTTEILEQLSFYTLRNEIFPNAALITLPIEIQVVNQDLPVYFVVRSMICPSTIEMSEKELSFGKIYLGQKSIKKLRCRNLSMLPQKIAFVRLKKEVTIQPNDGFAVLLPLEEIEFDVSFAPLSAIEYKFDLTLMTSWNDTFTIPLHAFGVEPPIVISNTVVQMRTTAPGQHVVESISLTNQSSNIQCFEVMIPDKRFTWLNISPTCLDLAPGQSCRLEVDYCPPSNVVTLDPIQWHQNLVKDLGVQNPDVTTPFSDWINDHPWMIGTGLYGNVQWSMVTEEKSEDNGEENQNEIINEDQNPETEDKMQANERTDTGPDNNLQTTESTSILPSSMITPKSLPKQDFGIFSKWDIPILIKSKKRSTAINNQSQPPATNAFENTLGSPNPLAGSINLSASLINHTLGNKPIPLMISVETAVILPQIEADQTLVNFGQMAIGTRQLKSFKIFNHSQYETIELQSIGLNAVGPFTLIRPIKSIKPQQSKTIIVECLPRLPGLNTEVLEIFTKDNEVKGGHQLQITCQVQGLMPVISLNGLLPPPPSHLLSTLANAQKLLDSHLSSVAVNVNDDILPPKTSAVTIWNNRSGILDFGNVVISDIPIIRKFVIKNHSSFRIQANIRRFSSNGITNLSEKQEMIEKTVIGLPVISVRPEEVSIEPNSSEEIEVIFRPDHYRLYPYREDFQVIVGETDEILHVGVIGRVFTRQYNLLPSNVLDELMYYHNYNNNLSNTHLMNECYQILEKNFLKGTLFNTYAEEKLQFYYQENIRKLISESKNQFQLLPMKLTFPYMILKFLNPYDSNVSPDTYVVVDNPTGSAPVAGKAAKTPSAKDAPPPSTTATTYRKQTKKLKLFSAKSGNNGKEVANPPGTFEVQLSQPAKDSGLFSVSVEKGNVTPAKDEFIEISCTQPKPRSLGGVPVGSWKTYDAIVILKGGYFPGDETDENRVPIKLMAYVSI